MIHDPPPPQSIGEKKEGESVRREEKRERERERERNLGEMVRGRGSSLGENHEMVC